MRTCPSRASLQPQPRRVTLGERWGKAGLTAALGSQSSGRAHHEGKRCCCRWVSRHDIGAVVLGNTVRAPDYHVSVDSSNTSTAVGNCFLSLDSLLWDRCYYYHFMTSSQGIYNLLHRGRWGDSDDHPLTWNVPDLPTSAPPKPSSKKTYSACTLIATSMNVYDSQEIEHRLA